MHIFFDPESRIARPIRATTAVLALSAATALSAAALPQRPFVNYEVGPVHPVTAHTFQAGSASRDVLLGCNTPNNALEFYDTAGGMSLISSIPTGLAPVTVRWDAVTGAVYTCNHIGDSVTKVSVVATTSDAGGVDLDIRLVGAYRVGDGPCDFVMVPAGTGESGSEAAMLISLRSRNGVTEGDPVTMQVSPNKERIVL